MSYSSWIFLLIRFSRDSLANSKRRNKNGSTDSTNSSRSSASVTPHQELYTVTVNTCHDDDDDGGDETAAAREGETKGEPKSTELVQQPRGRRQSISTLATEYSIVSIAAVSNIVNMILAPMVIVPFLDYLTLGKIPRSNTAKPGTSDGAFAKMGSLKSISQPLTNGWTVIFVSVSSGASLRSLPRTSLHPTALDSANDAPIIIFHELPMI